MVSLSETVTAKVTFAGGEPSARAAVSGRRNLSVKLSSDAAELPSHSHFVTLANPRGARPPRGPNHERLFAIFLKPGNMRAEQINFRRVPVKRTGFVAENDSH
jgi:hypothetical protein